MDLEYYGPLFNKVKLYSYNNVLRTFIIIACQLDFFTTNIIETVIIIITNKNYLKEFVSIVNKMITIVKG